MSEPTGDIQEPDPVHVQDELSGSMFSDPTAPVWVAQTPSAPPPVEHHTPSTPADPPASNPYARPAQPEYNQAYGQAYGQPPPGYGPQYLGAPAPTQANVSAIALVVMSGITICNLLSIVSLILGIIALTKNSKDPESSRKLTIAGWIVFAVASVMWAGSYVVRRVLPF